jgi:hypothetical protein
LQPGVFADGIWEEGGWLLLLRCAAARLLLLLFAGAGQVQSLKGMSVVCGDEASAVDLSDAPSYVQVYSFQHFARLHRSSSVSAELDFCSCNLHVFGTHGLLHMP